MHRYITWNGAMPTTAALVKVTTGTAIKTMLQLSTPATRQLTVLSWGFTLDAAPATTGVGVVELIGTDVAATVTAHSASGVMPLDPNAPASLLTLGTANTGYTGSVEGSTTAGRLFDNVEVQGVSNGPQSNTYVRTFPPNQQPVLAVSKFLRVRATFGAAVNMACWIMWDE